MCRTLRELTAEPRKSRQEGDKVPQPLWEPGWVAVAEAALRSGAVLVGGQAGFGKAEMNSG